MSETQIDPRIARLIEITKELEARKALYAEFDALVLELASEAFVSAVVGEVEVRLRDNFASSNTGWTAAAVKRFDIEIDTPERLAAKDARAAAKRAKREEAV